MRLTSSQLIFENSRAEVKYVTCMRGACWRSAMRDQRAQVARMVLIQRPLHSAFENAHRNMSFWVRPVSNVPTTTDHVS